MTFTDHVYATKSGVDLELRVFPARKPGRAPWLFWSHGGAFLFCYHQGVIPWIYHNLDDYHIVSWSYRLAPVASISDMVSDGMDAYAWCRRTLPAMLDVDIDALLVGGDSAGGCLALLMGGLLPARAVLCDQGIADLSDAWFDTHPDVPSYSGEFAMDEIVAAAADRDPAHALIGAACFDGPVPSEEDVQKEFSSKTIRFGRAERLQLDVRQYLASTSWVRSTVHAEGAAAVAELRKWSALHRLDAATSYPPTFFVHGEEDVCVPPHQSRKMAAKLREMGVEVGEHYEPGAGHCFNHRFTNDESADGFERCVRAPLQFVDRHVRRQ